jgi:hypothetical protein
VQPARVVAGAAELAVEREPLAGRLEGDYKSSFSCAA